MFSLDGTCRYWLYNKPVDMRKSFNELGGIVTNAMCGNQRSGDVYIFINSSRNMMKMLRHDEGGMVLYAIRLDMGRMRVPAIGGEDVISSSLPYENVIGMVRSALESPYVRRMKLLADIFINKFVYHLPFYRQIQKYKEMGAVFSDATIGDWFAAVCAKLRPLYDALRREVLQSAYIQVDESTIPVIKEEKPRKAVKEYMWTVRDALGGAVCFHYDHGSHSGETCRKLIGGYVGTMQTDGYEVYEAYENAPGKRLIGCWAHARRKFVEALEEDKKHASEALVYIGKLYKLEEEMREAELEADAIRERRQKEAYPIIQDFEKWMDAVSSGMSTKSLIGQAVSYAYVLLPRLSRYVLDGRYQIDNNGIENAIRPLALGRKNYLFAGNHAAAVRAALAYSFIASCKAVGVDVRTWLVDVLGRIPSHNGSWQELLPAHWQQHTPTER